MKLKGKTSLNAALLLLLIPTISQAVPVATDIVAGALNSTIAGVADQLQTLAFKWLSSFVLAQFLITNLMLLKSGADIEAVIGKLMGGLLWFGFCFYVVTNGPDFIKFVGNGMFDMAGNISGAPGVFSAGYVFDWGFRLSKTLMNAVNVATGSSWFAKLDFMPSLFTFVSCLVIMAVSGLIGFKVFLVKIELMLTIMMSPLSFSFLGINALKDQGISPFKSLISLVYRVMLLAVLVSAMGKVGEVLVGVFGAVDQGSVSDVWNPVFAGLMIFSLMGYLAFKSDAIAANLASGSTNMGTADVASAAAMGAAAGAAIATGGASVAAGAAKAGQPMGDFMKSLAGSGGGSVSNASSSGTGPAPTGQAPVPPSMSMGVGGPSAANKPPARPTPVNAGSNALSNPPAATSAPTPSSSGGSEANAGIGAPPSSLEQQVGDLVKTLNQPKLEKGVTEHLSELNQHVAREQASTHVSINTHHSE
jgi:type IV secretion system protein TrbL